MKFDAVIFDLFGTLIDNFSKTDHRKVLSNMAAVLGVSAEAFIPLWIETFPLRCIGELKTTEDNIVHVMNSLKALPSSDQIKEAADLKLNYSRDALVPKQNMMETLNRIKKTGYKTALLSDCSSEVPAVWSETPFATVFDVVVFSCKAGIKKPDVEIYELVCRKLAVPPSACLYCGDGSSNELTGAKRAGMFPVQFKDPGELDAHRVDDEAWNGEKIHAIQDILHYL